MQTASLKMMLQQSDGMTPQLPQRRQRLLDIDRTKALAIIFVVLGHISDPHGPEWASILRMMIYNFHMPLFMFLSGYVFVYSSSHIMKRRFGTYILNRVNRLLVPFFVMAIVIVSLKLVGSRYTDLNRSAVTLIEAFQFIFINTQQSPALDLWYLFVLFVFAVLTPVLYWLFGERLWPLAFISTAMYAYFVNGVLTDDFYVSRICWFYIFFIAGCLACHHLAVWVAFIDRSWPFALMLFLVADAGTILQSGILASPWRYLIVGLLSAVGFQGLMRSSWLRDEKLLSFIAESTLAIYLLNTIFIALARAVFIKFADSASSMFLVYIVCFPIGLIGPIVFRQVLSRFSVTRPILLYLR